MHGPEILEFSLNAILSVVKRSALSGLSFQLLDATGSEKVTTENGKLFGNAWGSNKDGSRAMGGAPALHVRVAELPQANGKSATFAGN